MLLHIVSVCPMFRRCRGLKRYIAISSFSAQYAQYLYNMSKYIGGKAALEIGGKWAFFHKRTSAALSDKCRPKCGRGFWNAAAITRGN